MLHRSWIIACFFVSIHANSQSFVYSRNYFRWPVKARPAIVANFGELREGHWHMGLDVRTNGKENMPVHAAAAGYIARISVHPFGYGRAIYINHPNGLTTVYGHLNKFSSKMDSFVRRQQYLRQSWEIELEFPKNKFPVKQGEFIGWSGSTGSSQGPHVHFEIRDTKTERCINPLLFHLPIPDKVAPVFTTLALYDRARSVYDQTPVLLQVKKAGPHFFLKDSMIRTAFSKLGFGISAYDRVSKSTNRNGIYSARIFLDGAPLAQFVLDSMDYDETAYVNAHIDYPHRYNGGEYIQELFKLPGDHGRAYRPAGASGVIQLRDPGVHHVRIEIADANGNGSSLRFDVQHIDSLNRPLTRDSKKIFSPNNVNIFEQDDFELYLTEDCLYDSLEPVFRRLASPGPDTVSSFFQFCDASTPVHGFVNLRLRSNRRIPAALRDKLVIQRVDSREINFRRADWQRGRGADSSLGWLAAKFTDFGMYRAFIDTTAPVVNEPGPGDTVDLSLARQIVFYPKDNTRIKSFRAELDGHWLMFSNDKGAAWIYTFDENCPYGLHHLKVWVEDMVGNVAEKEWLFRRVQLVPAKTKIAHWRHGSMKSLPNRKKLK